MATYSTNTVKTTRQVGQNDTGFNTTIEVNNTTYTRKPDISDYIGIGLLVLIVIIAIAGFIKSVCSRKYYKCPSCGESFRSENMDSMTCKVCGATLEETDDTNITDKTK